MSRSSDTRPPGHESADAGFAMIVAVMVATIALVLVTTILAMGLHLNVATVRDRKLQQALQVAELGIDRTASQLGAALTAGTPFVNSVTPTSAPGGEVAVKVLPITNGYQIDAIGWVPNSTNPNAARRHLRVTYLPEPSFKYALFSNSGLFVKSAGGIDGDVFGTLDVELWNGTIVRGSVTSANGNIRIDQGAEIRKDAAGKGGDANAGGLNTGSSPKWAVRLDSNTSRVEGNVRTKVPAAGTPCPNGSDYNVVNDGEIVGSVFTPGTVTGAAPAGGITAACEQRPVPPGLPVFNEGSIPGLTTISPATFEAMPTLQGKYLVTGTETDFIDFDCQTITGDFTLVTHVVIKKANTCGSTPFYSGPSTALIEIISLNSSKVTQADPAVDVENSLDLPPSPSPSPALLLYSKGFCDLKNTVVTSGAVYCNGINIQNTLDIRYDGRVQAALGFGANRYVKAGFLELPSGTPLP